MNRRLSFRRRETRWGLGLLGGLLLLVGLILNAKAQSPLIVEGSQLHTFRPVFIEERALSSALHPPARLVAPNRTSWIANPTAHGDIYGQSCRGCHNAPRVQASLLHGAGHRTSSLASLGPSSCEDCHANRLSLAGAPGFLY